MPARKRIDEPGFHHVANRGLGRRSLFECEEDFRFFLARLATAVRRGWLEVHSYCLMSNHFHLLVRRREVPLADPMKYVQSTFVRWFNECRGRDGPLMKSRFFSRPIVDDADRWTVVRYIDHNPVKAGLVGCATEYRYGSAWHYARDDGPMWLERSEVERDVAVVSGRGVFHPGDYSHVIAGEPPAGANWLVEERLRLGAGGEQAHQVLRCADASAVQRWIESATAADGTKVGYVLAPPESILKAIAWRRIAHAPWQVLTGRRPRDPWTLLTAGLLRLGARCSLKEIAARLSSSVAGVTNTLAHHATAMRVDPVYSRLAGEILHECLREVELSPYLSCGDARKNDL